MWGIPIGMLLGAAGYGINCIFAKKTTRNENGRSAAAALAAVKFTVIYGIFAILTLAGAGVMLFAAGGYVAALLGFAFFGKKLFIK